MDGYSIKLRTSIHTIGVHEFQNFSGSGLRGLVKLTLEEFHPLARHPHRKWPSGPTCNAIYTDAIFVRVQPDKVGLSTQNIFHLRAIQFGSQMRLKIKPVVARLNAVDVPIQSNHRRAIPREDVVSAAGLGLPQIALERKTVRLVTL